MADKSRPPHDRGGKLWDHSSGPTRLLISSFDRWTSAILADDGIDMPLMGSNNPVEARIISHSDGTLAGCAAVDHMLQIWAGSVSISWAFGDGRKVNSGDEVARLKGDRETILAMERPILNILGQLSGISSEAHKWSAKAPKQIACTRKTIWGLLDKWAVQLGGGLTHRLTKLDARMLKENDLASMYPELESHGARIARFISEDDQSQNGAFLEIEVRDEKEAIMAAFSWSEKRMIDGCDKITLMLDNFGPERCKNVSDELSEMDLRKHVWLEASGGVTLNDLDDWKQCGIDVISTSAINRGCTPLDISMLVNDA